MYSSYTVRYFVHSLAQATGASKYDVVVLGTDLSYEQANREVFHTMYERKQWDNDGFNAYVKFELLNNNTREASYLQYNYSDRLRTYEPRPIITGVTPSATN